MQMKPKVYQFLVGVFASFGSILYGYDLGVIAQVIASESFIQEFNVTSSDPKTGAVVALFTGGAFFGAFFASPTAERLGRRWTIEIGALLFILGGALQTGAPNIGTLMAGRFIAGLAVGFLTMIVPLYQAEIAHPSIRGTVTALQQFMLGIGALVAAWVGWGCYNIYSDNRQWRIPLGIQIIPSIFLAALIFLFPESPRWLIDQNRQEEGLKTLARLHSNGDEHDAWVQAEYGQIQETVAFEHEREVKSYVELFTNPSCFRRIFLAMSLQASVQMTGVSAIQYYSVTIYAQAGINANDALKYQAINSVLALVAQALCVAFIDNFGRRWTLIWGNLFNMLTFIVATALLAIYPPGTSTSAQGWGFIIVTWCFNFSFSACCGPLSWIIPAEIFDTRTRAKGVSVATMTSFAFNTMIGQVTGIAMAAIGWRFYLLFVVCNLTNALFFWAFLPETKKVPLEEMNYLFTHAPWFVPGFDQDKLLQEVRGDLERRREEILDKEAVVGEGVHVDHVSEKI